MDLTNVFGVNVKEQFLEWLHGDFKAEFEQRFPGKTMTLIMVDPDDFIDITMHWRSPLRSAMIVAHLGNLEEATNLDGTLRNVVGKLRFVLRTMMSSGYAESKPELVREGDFPHEGAGEHENQIGGVSGLKKEEDWELFCTCAEKLNELLAAVNAAAIAKSDELRARPDCPVGTKYLIGISVAPNIPAAA